MTNKPPDNTPIDQLLARAEEEGARVDAFEFTVPEVEPLCTITPRAEPPAPISDELTRPEQQFLVGLFQEHGDFGKAYACVEQEKKITNSKELMHRGLLVWQNTKVQEEYIRLSGKMASREGPLFLGAAISMHDIAVDKSAPNKERIQAANALFKAAGEKQEIKQIAEIGPDLADVMRRLKVKQDTSVLEAHYERIEE